jgi:hypothetical protein
MAYRSRLLDLGCRIWYIMWLVFFAAVLWWQEWRQVGRWSSGISFNKAGASSPSVLVIWRITDQSIQSSFDVLPRWKTEREFVGDGSVNKRCSCLIWFPVEVVLPLAGRGGEGSKQIETVVSRLGGSWGSHAAVHGVLQWQRSGVVVIQGNGSRSVLWAWMLHSFSDQPPWRRPFDDFLPAFISLATPSGCVPGVAEGAGAGDRAMVVEKIDLIAFVVIFLGSFLHIMRTAL